MKHYMADLENQVSQLQSGNDRIEEEKNTLILNVTDLHRTILTLQEDAQIIHSSLEKEKLSKDKLQADTSKTEWHAKQLQLIIERLTQEKKALQAKALKQGLPAAAGLNSRANDSVPPPPPPLNLSAMILLSFAGSLGVTCACCLSSTCQRIASKRRNQRAANLDDPPDTASIISQTPDHKDLEDVPWRPVASEDRDDPCKKDGAE